MLKKMSLILLSILILGSFFPASLSAQEGDKEPTENVVVAPEKNPVPEKPADGEKAEVAPQNNKKDGGEKETASFFSKAISFSGIFILLLIAYGMSSNRKAISWRPVIWGVALQLIFGLIVLSPAMSKFFFETVDGGVNKLLSFSSEGAAFVLQSVHPNKSTVMDLSNGQFEERTYPDSGLTSFIPKVNPIVKTFAFWILPTIIFFSSLMTLLYHLGIMQYVIRFFAWIMQKTMGTSGAESLSAAANIFVGQTEAPLVIKPFVEKMTVSELNAVMVGGFATVAGGVMAAYVMFLQNIPGIAGHLVVASIMSAPAALAVAKVIYPETEESVTAGELKMEVERPDANAIEAAARGASEGMSLALNVAAMLIAFVALIAMVNFCIGVIPIPASWSADGSTHLSLQTIFGWIFYPIAFFMGVELQDCFIVGVLLGEKLVLTEFLAYIHLGDLMSQGVLQERSAIIASYALCGFANFASIGIQLGGIGGIAPSRRSDLAKIGLKAMFGGAIAACMTGTVAGILI